MGEHERRERAEERARARDDRDRRAGARAQALGDASEQEAHSEEQRPVDGQPQEPAVPAALVHAAVMDAERVVDPLRDGDVRQGVDRHPGRLVRVPVPAVERHVRRVVQRVDTDRHVVEQLLGEGEARVVLSRGRVGGRKRHERDEEECEPLEPRAPPRELARVTGRDPH